MDSLEYLKEKRDSEIHKKNKLLKQKWAVEDEIDQLKKGQFQKNTYSHRDNYFRSLNGFKNELFHIKNELNVINNNLNELNIQIKEKELKLQIIKRNNDFEEINAEYISNENLSKKDIQNFILRSENVSKRFDDEIANHSLFIGTIDSHLKNNNNEFEIYDLNRLKLEIETRIEELSEHQKQCSHFKCLDKLVSYSYNYSINLIRIESNFNNSKSILLEFANVINRYRELLESIPLNLKRVHENFLNDDFELMKNKINYNILFLLKNQNRCFDFRRHDALNEILVETTVELENMESSFNKSTDLLIKFDSAIKSYSSYFNKLDSNISDLKDNYYCDDLNKLKFEIETKKKELSNHFKYEFEFDSMDELSEELANSKKWLLDMKNKFNKSHNLSMDFDSTIKDYSIFLMKVNSDFDEFSEKYHGDDLKNIVDEIEIKNEDILNYQKKCFEFDCFDDLNHLIEIAKKDLEDLQTKFKQIKRDIYEELISNSVDLINEKLEICSELNSKVSILIEGTDEFSSLIDKNELLTNLKEIKTSLNQEFENLNAIKNNLNGTTFENTVDIDFDKELFNINNLEDMLNQLSFEDFEKSIDEQEQVFEKLSHQNMQIDEEETIGILIDDFEKCFNKPMFRRQLKRYNLKDDELDIVKSEIKNDIINLVIVDGSDFKQIIKTRCSEFRKTHSEFDDNDLDRLIDIENYTDIDEEILIECRDLVKKDISSGNITINNAQLKFNVYLNKKIDEKNQLKELEEIKNNPAVPSIKVHLSQEENNEVYAIVQNEIVSEFGIGGSVENRVYYWCNQKIRENQSHARGRLNTIKREFSNLTQLNEQEQNDFIVKIEFLINENKIKPHEITEENIIGLSEDFMNNKL